MAPQGERKLVGLITRSIKRTECMERLKKQPWSSQITTRRIYRTQVYQNRYSNVYSSLAMFPNSAFQTQQCTDTGNPHKRHQPVISAAIWQFLHEFVKARARRISLRACLGGRHQRASLVCHRLNVWMWDSVELVEVELVVWVDVDVGTLVLCAVTVSWGGED